MFLRANLNGQTSVRVDAHWASQATCLQGMSEFCLPDRVLREEDLARDLSEMALRFGAGSAPEWPSVPEPHLARLVTLLFVGIVGWILWDDRASLLGYVSGAGFLVPVQLLLCGAAAWLVANEDHLPGPVTLLLDSRESRRGHTREPEAGNDG